MGDRVRLGELLAATGAIGLAVLLAFGAWFEVGPPETDPTAAGVFAAGTAGSTHLGWFAFAVAVAAAVAGLVYLFRILTARGPERVMLQGPIAYAVGLFALLVVFVRVVLFTPGFDLDLPSATGAVTSLHFDGDVTPGGWLGLLALFLIPFGTWISLADERTESPGAKRRTAELLAQVPVRPAPLAVTGGRSAPESEAQVVADDAAGDDSSSSSSPSGGPA